MRNDLILDPWQIGQKSNQWVDDFAETIFFLGNGRMGCRGYVPFEPERRPVHQGLFLAGIFGEIKPGITDFVNLPTPVYDEILINGVAASLTGEIKKILNIRDSILAIEFTLNHDIHVKTERFFSSTDSRFLVQRSSITAPKNYTIQVRTGINEESCNCPVPDDQVKDNHETIRLAKRINFSTGKSSFKAEYLINGTNLKVSEEISVSTKGFHIAKICEDAVIVLEGNSVLADGENSKSSPEVTTYTYEKLTLISSSRDIQIDSAFPTLWSYDDLLVDHIEFWKKKWEVCDIDEAQVKKTFPDREDTVTALRYNIFQLVNNCSRLDPTVSIGARGLTHTRYKGCYFWDTDVFMLPFYLATDKEAAKNLCLYRINNLEAARDYAKKMNCLGARFPWMTSFDGSEQCETWDIGCSEIHITADVAYAIDNYCKKYNDKDFYLNFACELYAETARYWFSRYTYDADHKVANLLFCKGPDEYCGVTTNNLFTNVMVKHNLTLAIDAAKDLKEKNPALFRKLAITESEINSWKDLKRDIPLPRDPKTGHLTTDDTFHLLEPVDLAEIKPDDSASYHTTCFDRLQRYKVIKQADVLLLMTRLQNLFSEEERLTAWNDFEPLCLHDSTLSFASHSLFAVQNNLQEKAIYYFNKALFLDIYDVMNNTGKEGLHMAGMGEIWQAALYMDLLKLKA